MDDKAIDIKDQVKEAFMANLSLTYRDVSEDFGVPYETVRGWGKEEGWILERNKRFLADVPDDIAEQAGDIRRVVFAHIVGDDITTQELVDLVKSWKLISDIVEISSEGVDRDALLSSVE